MIIISNYIKHQKSRDAQINEHHILCNIVVLSKDSKIDLIDTNHNDCMQMYSPIVSHLLDQNWKTLRERTQVTAKAFFWGGTTSSTKYRNFTIIG